MKSSELIDLLAPVTAKLFVLNEDYPADRARELVAAGIASLEQRDEDDDSNAAAHFTRVVSVRMRSFGLLVHEPNLLVGFLAECANAWLAERSSNDRPMERAGRAPEEEQHEQNDEMEHGRALDARPSHGGSR